MIPATPSSGMPRFRAYTALMICSQLCVRFDHKGDKDHEVGYLWQSEAVAEQNRVGVPAFADQADCAVDFLRALGKEIEAALAMDL